MVELVGSQTIDVNGPVNICVSRGKINPLSAAGENGLLISFLEASKGHHLVSNFPIFLPPLPVGGTGFLWNKLVNCL